MKITQEGDNVRFVLMEKEENTNNWWELMNFTVDKSNYEELKKHMIKALERFKVK